MPCRMIEWVCPPQTSIIAQGWVVTAWIWSSSLRARSGLLNSSRYFMIRPFRIAACFAAAEAVAELLLEDAELLEVGQRLQRRLLVEPLDGEADVDDDVFADLRVRDVLQADAPCGRRRSRPRPSACRRPRRCSGSARGPPGTWCLLSPIHSAECADQQLTERDAAVVGRQQPWPQDREAPLAPARDGAAVEQQRVLEHAAAERHQCRGRSRRGSARRGRRSAPPPRRGTGRR